MAKLTKQPTAAFNPFYGCAILFIAITVFGGIITWAMYSFSKQDSEIGKFTVEQPVKPTATLPDAAGVAALQARLKSFAADASAGKEAAITLSIPELNALMDIAPDTGYGKFTEMIAFKGTKGDAALVADVCFPLNKMKFWEGKRYAVGDATFNVEIIKDRGPDMKLGSLSIPGKEVNTGFLEAFGGWHWLTPYQKLDALGPVLKRITSVKTSPNGIELTAKP